MTNLLLVVIIMLLCVIIYALGKINTNIYLVEQNNQIRYHNPKK